jgi:hypothetical protein
VRKTTVCLPDELKARVERVARETRRPEAEVIRAAIEAYTNGKRPRPRPLFDTLGKPLGENVADEIDKVLAEGFGEG